MQTPVDILLPENHAAVAHGYFGARCDADIAFIDRAMRIFEAEPVAWRNLEEPPRGIGRLDCRGWVRSRGRRGFRARRVGCLSLPTSPSRHGVTLPSSASSAGIKRVPAAAWRRTPRSGCNPDSWLRRSFSTDRPMPIHEGWISGRRRRHLGRGSRANEGLGRRSAGRRRVGLRQGALRRGVRQPSRSPCARRCRNEGGARDPGAGARPWLTVAAFVGTRALRPSRPIARVRSPLDSCGGRPRPLAALRAPLHELNAMVWKNYDARRGETAMRDSADDVPEAPAPTPARRRSRTTPATVDGVTARIDVLVARIEDVATPPEGRVTRSGDGRTCGWVARGPWARDAGFARCPAAVTFACSGGPLQRRAERAPG